MNAKPIDIAAFATTQLSLLEAELAAETLSTSALFASATPTALARAGLAIPNLVIASQRTGLGGRIVLELEHDPAIGTSEAAREHGIRVGDIVRVAEQPKGDERKKEKAVLAGRGVEGVVAKAGHKALQITLGQDDDVVEGLLGTRVWV